MREAVNVAITMPGRPLGEQLQRAVEAGFAGVELYWPWDVPDPGDSEVGGFVATVRDGGLPLVNLGLYAGDLAAGERGIAAVPGRQAQLLTSAQVAARIAAELDLPVVTGLYGNRVEGWSAQEQDAAATAALAAAARVLAGAGVRLALEPVSGIEAYPLRSVEDLVAARDRVIHESGVPTVTLLADLYHLAVNGEDVDGLLARGIDSIGHVQVADAPGRGAPGTGTLPIDRWLAALEAGGYPGWVSYEYAPGPDGPFAWRTTTSTEEDR